MRHVFYLLFFVILLFQPSDGGRVRRERSYQELEHEPTLGYPNSLGTVILPGDRKVYMTREGFVEPKEDGEPTLFGFSDIQSDFIDENAENRFFSSVYVTDGSKAIARIAVHTIVHYTDQLSAIGMQPEMKITQQDIRNLYSCTMSVNMTNPESTHVTTQKQIIDVDHSLYLNWDYVTGFATGIDALTRSIGLPVTLSASGYVHDFVPFFPPQQEFAYDEDVNGYIFLRFMVRLCIDASKVRRDLMHVSNLSYRRLMLREAYAAGSESAEPQETKAYDESKPKEDEDEEKEVNGEEEEEDEEIDESEVTKKCVLVPANIRVHLNRPYEQIIAFSSSAQLVSSGTQPSIEPLVSSAYGQVRRSVEPPECASDSCSKDGTKECKIEVNDGVLVRDCVCKDGYVGPKCELLEGKCVPGDDGSCKNHGLCTELTHWKYGETYQKGHQCECGRGYEGERCENLVCDRLDCCLNGGKCDPYNEEAGCDCDGTEFEGKYCQAPKDSCNPTNPCLNGGKCNDTIASFDCECQDGFEGKTCDAIIPKCSDTCDHGHCIPLLHSLKKMCECDDGYSGDNCDLHTHPCAGVECGNGECVEIEDEDLDSLSFHCVCSPGFKNGLYDVCDIDINECEGHNDCGDGVCVDAVDGFTCECPATRSGERCEYIRNLCDPNPCQQGGHCTQGDHDKTLTCHCPDGIDGRLCEININECQDENICNHRGNCTDLLADFKCECDEGYHGEQCEYVSDLCHKHECHTGHCEEHIDNENGERYRVCICPPGYTGDKCDVQIDYCSSNSCQNGATCLSMADRFVCSCQSGYEGEHCEQDTDECSAPNLCANGVCVNTDGGYVCNCNPGFSGEHCTDKVSACWGEHGYGPSPCLNGGNCTEMNGLAYCSCTPGFTGLTCENVLPLCEHNPCGEGKGECDLLLGDYRCNCHLGYELKTLEEVNGGDRCVNIDDCNPNPCHNGGICKDYVNGHGCECQAPWTGADCLVRAPDNTESYK